jgi:hypothetical protein
MTKSDNQHFIQRRFLSHWTCTPKKKYKNQQIFMYDKKKKKLIKTNLRNAASINHFLKKEADDVISQIENQLFPIIKRVIEKEHITSRKIFTSEESLDNLFGIYRYLAYQFYRTPRYRKKLSEIMKLIDPKKLKDTQSDFFIKKTMPFLFNPDLMGIFKAKPHKEPLLAQMYSSWNGKRSKIGIRDVDNFGMLLIEGFFPILEINDTDVPYLTNDLGYTFYMIDFRKSISFVYLPHKPVLGVSYPSMISWLSFPLSSKVIINFCTYKSVSNWCKTVTEQNTGLVYRNSNEKSVKIINKFIYMSSNRFVYSNDQKLLEEISNLNPS